MDTHIHFVTTPTADTPGTTLVLTTPRKHYVFGNNAEGTQRAATQMGHRLTKVQDFFITGQTNWKNMGGLMGLALTLADATATAHASQMEVWRKAQAQGKKMPEPERPKMNLFGPPNLKHMLGTCRRFIFRKGLPIVATELHPCETPTSSDGKIPPTWTDDTLQVWALSVSPTRALSAAQAQEEADSTERAAARFDANFNSFENHQPVPGESKSDRTARFDQMRTAVLRAMFDSTWSFDTLVERHISEIEMPTAMYIRNPETRALEPYRGPKPGGNDPLPDVKVLTRTPWPGAMIMHLPPTQPAHESVSYIVRTQKVRGKFDVKRAQELKVPKGQAYSQLASGQSVVSDNGDTITPDMVLGPDRPGQGVAILDAPTVAHLEELVRRRELQDKGVMEGIQAFIWILGPGVAGHPSFTDFTQSLSQYKHVVASVDVNTDRLALESVARQTVRLGQIDPIRYHVPFHDNTTLPQQTLRSKDAACDKLPTEITAASAGLSFRLMPRFEMHEETIPPPLDLEEARTSIPPAIMELAQAAHQEIEQDQEKLQAWRRLLARPDTEVITLGTGSALPSKYRNVSATLVRVPGIGNYLFDCGENTLGQLQRVFGPKEIVNVFRNLRMIWISHLHADHHLGTASVIKAWYEVVHDSVPASTPPSMPSMSWSSSAYGLSVISHEGMLRWLKEYSAVEDFGYSRILPLQVDPSQRNTGSALTLWPAPRPDSLSAENTLQPSDYEKVLGFTKIQACRVSHCFGAMAVSITFPREADSDPTIPPLKVSYSGDCRPSANFAQLGKDTTVLIHEATFDDELQGDAVAKKHSTTSEALGIGAKMNAKAVVLTHFSQRYQKIPILQTIADGEEDGSLEPDAMEDVTTSQVQAEEQTVEDEPDDPTTGNVDMTTINVSASSNKPALPSDTVSATAEQQAPVIKIRAKDMKVAVAFDYMRVKIGEIAQMEKFNAALNKLLADEETAEDETEEGKVAVEKGKGKGGKGKKARESLGETEGSKKKKCKRNN